MIIQGRLNQPAFLWGGIWQHISGLKGADSDACLGIFLQGGN